MLMCVFTRTIWAAICAALDSPACIPSTQDSLVEWAIDKRGSNNVSTKDLRTIFALTWWELWMHRNANRLQVCATVGLLVAKKIFVMRVWFGPLLDY